MLYWKVRERENNYVVDIITAKLFTKRNLVFQAP